MLPVGGVPTLFLLVLPMSLLVFLLTLPTPRLVLLWMVLLVLFLVLLLLLLLLVVAPVAMALVWLVLVLLVWLVVVATLAMSLVGLVVVVGLVWLVVVGCWRVWWGWLTSWWLGLTGWVVMVVWWWSCFVSCIGWRRWCRWRPGSSIGVGGGLTMGHGRRVRGWLACVGSLAVRRNIGCIWGRWRTRCLLVDSAGLPVRLVVGRWRCWGR